MKHHFTGRDKDKVKTVGNDGKGTGKSSKSAPDKGAKKNQSEIRQHAQGSPAEQNSGVHSAKATPNKSSESAQSKKHNDDKAASQTQLKKVTNFVLNQFYKNFICCELTSRKTHAVLEK